MASAGGGAQGRSSDEGQGQGLAHRPHSDPEQRDVHGGRLAGPLAVEEGAHDPAGDGHRPDGVAEPGGRRWGDQVVLGPLGAGGHPGPGPERQGVVRALVGVGPPLALAGAPHVDDGRVVGPDLVEVDVELGDAPPGACW